MQIFRSVPKRGRIVAAVALVAAVLMCVVAPAPAVEDAAPIYPDHIVKRPDQERYDAARPLKTGSDGLVIRQLSGYLYLALLDYEIAADRFKSATSAGEVTIAREANISCKGNLEEAEKLEGLLGGSEKASELNKKLVDAIAKTKKKQESLKAEIFKKEFPNTDPKIAQQLERLQEDFTKEKLRTREKEVEANRRLIALTAVYGDVIDGLVSLKAQTTDIQKRLDDMEKLVESLRPAPAVEQPVEYAPGQIVQYAPGHVVEHASAPRCRVLGIRRGR